MSWRVARTEIIVTQLCHDLDLNEADRLWWSMGEGGQETIDIPDRFQLDSTRTMRWFEGNYPILVEEDFEIEFR